jgi:hypothetical protein
VTTQLGNHQRFRERLKESATALFIVAHYFHLRGFRLMIDGQHCAATAAEHEKFADNGDLCICYRGEWFGIEVKGLNTEFTDMKDWPHKNFMVCAKHSYDKTLPNPPSSYYLLNKSRTHAAVVKTSTYPDWFVKTTQCGNYNNVSQDFYYCPLDKVEWITI